MKDKKYLPMLIVLYVSAFGGAFNNNLVNVAIPGFIAEFAIDSAMAQWSVSGYMIITLLGVTSMAFLFRRFKMRTLFFVAQGCNILGNLIAMVAPTFSLVIIGRLVQGVGTGLIQPMMMNTVLILAKPQRRGTMLAIGSTIITLAPAFAPAVSGGMVTLFGWRAVFVPSAVLAAVLLVIGALLLQNVNEPKEASFDIASAILLALGLVPFAFGLTRIVSAPAIAAVFLALGAVVLVVFGMRQLKLDDPLLNIRPLALSGFWPACFIVFCALMVNFATCMVLPLYYQDALGLSAFMSGVFILVPVLFNTLSALFAGPLVDRHGPWPLIPIGVALMLSSQVLVVFCTQSALIAAVVVVSCLGSFGVGLTSAPVQSTGLSHLDPSQNPHGVALITAFIQLAGCMAPALYVGIKGAVQANEVAQGQALALAAQSGCTIAFVVASCLTLLGLVISVVYCWRYRKQ